MDLVQLDPDHPGFRDRAYRERRNRIAALAAAHRSGSPIPGVAYTEAEHEVWRVVTTRLEELHRTRVCGELRELALHFPLGRERVPQLGEITRRLEARTGFRMEPVGGLVAARRFLAALAERVFLSTQYVRHPSRPTYTPEPDVIHELVGHAASLAHPGLAELNRLLGQASLGADVDLLARLERLYWYTLEFGLVAEGGRPMAFGAGLLSSIEELETFQDRALLRDWDLERIAETDYDPTNLQHELFVAPSFQGMIDDLRNWLGARSPAAGNVG